MSSINKYCLDCRYFSQGTPTYEMPVPDFCCTLATGIIVEPMDDACENFSEDR